MTGDGTDYVKGIDYDAGPSVVHHSDPINIAPLAIWRRRREYANQLWRKWPNLFLPSGWQCTRSIVFLPQPWGKITRAGVVALHRVIVFTVEIAGIVIATLLIALLTLSVILVFAPTLALVVGK